MSCKYTVEYSDPTEYSEFANSVSSFKSNSICATASIKSIDCAADPSRRHAQKDSYSCVDYKWCNERTESVPPQPQVSSKCKSNSHGECQVESAASNCCVLSVGAHAPFWPQTPRVSCNVRNNIRAFGARRVLFTKSAVDTTSANICVQSLTTALSSVPAICPLAVACAIALASSPQQSHALCLPKSTNVSPVRITPIAKSSESYLYSAHEPITVTRYKHQNLPQTRINSLDLQITKFLLYQRRNYRIRSQINLD